MVATCYVATPPVAKECKYCGRHLDQYYAEIGVCPYCLDTADAINNPYDSVYYSSGGIICDEDDY